MATYICIFYEMFFFTLFGGYFGNEMKEREEEFLMRVAKIELASQRLV